jgi:hypothetical protein
MVVPRRLAARSLAALLGILAALALPAGGTAGAAATDDPLAGTFADVALVSSPEGGTGAPPLRLLAARAPDPTDPGTIVVDLLQADGDGWTRVDRLAVETGLDEPGPARLIPLDDRFALLATDLGGKTYVGLFVESPGGLRQTAASVEVLGRVSAGAADTDGNGSHELVLVGDAVPNGAGGCLWSQLVVMSGATLDHLVSTRIDGIGLDGGAIGRFGTAPGEDLLAYTHDGCATEQRSAPNSVAVIDLATGRQDPSLGIHSDRAPDQGAYLGPGPSGVEVRPESVNGPPGVGGPFVPLVADLDGDGIDEAILRSGPGVVVLDPAQGWRAEVIDANATPLAVVDPADRPRLVVARPAAGGESGGVRLLALGRVGGHGGDLIERGLAAIPPRPSDPSAGSPPGVDLATDPAAPPPIWVGELGSAGCRAVLVPSATFQGCPVGPTAWSSRLGPAWLQTVPLAAFGADGVDRLLVATGVDWATSQRGLAVPAPAATYVARNGRWRVGPSSLFTLGVVDPGPIVGSGSLSEPAVTIDPDVGDVSAPRLLVQAGAGDRVLVRIGPAAGEPSPPGPVQVPGADVARTLADFLLASQGDSHRSIQVAPVVESGSVGPGPAAVAFALPPLAETQTTAWSVTVLGLDSLGEASSFLAGRVELDLVGPALVVDRPFASAPWPLHASIRVTAEPGARVGLAGGQQVPAANDGTFALDAVLAPWPQDVVIRASDAHGNVTTTRVSLVGGIDYRQLPWQPLVIAVVLVAALFTTLGGPSLLRRRRTVSPPSDAGAIRSADDPVVAATGVRRRPGRVADELAEIEDLPRSGPGTGRRPAS